MGETQSDGEGERDPENQGDKRETQTIRGVGRETESQGDKRETERGREREKERNPGKQRSRKKLWKPWLKGKSRRSKRARAT